jgi:hypothetical protein
MPSPDSVSTTHTDDDHALRQPATQTTSAPPAATPEQLMRLAQLVADGELPFPGNLPLERKQRLLSEVQRRRRDRLVRHVARAIAEDILREAGPFSRRSQSDVET